MKKVLFIIAFKNFRDEEFLEPYTYLKNNGIDCTVASTQKGTAQGKLGATVKVHKTIEECEESFYDALILIGGPGSKVELWPHTFLISLIKDFYEHKKIIGAICSAAALLGIADIVAGKKVTSFPGEQEIAHLKNAHGVYTAAPVEKDGILITADGPASATLFAHELFKALVT